MSYITPVIVCGSEAWCLKVSEMGILEKNKEIHGDSNVWNTAQRLRMIYGHDVVFR